MPRKKNDGKRVATRVGQPRPLKEHSKNTSLAKILGRPISEDLSEAIYFACSVFASFGPDTKSSVLVKSISARIDKWKRQTKALRNQIWHQNELARRGRGQSLDVSSLKKRYFGAEAVGEIFSPYPMLFLANVMDAAIDSAELVLEQLNSPKYEGTHEDELWFIWVALLEATLRSWNIKTTAGSGDKMVRASAFVRLVEELQRLLPDDCFRRSTQASIAKGIQRARREYGGLPRHALVLLFISRSVGVYFRPDDPTLGPIWKDAARILHNWQPGTVEPNFPQ